MFRAFFISYNLFSTYVVQNKQKIENGFWFPIGSIWVSFGKFSIKVVLCDCAIWYSMRTIRASYKRKNSGNTWPTRSLTIGYKQGYVNCLYISLSLVKLKLLTERYRRKNDLLNDRTTVQYTTILSRSSIELLWSVQEITPIFKTEELWSDNPIWGSFCRVTPHQSIQHTRFSSSSK